MHAWQASSSRVRETLAAGDLEAVRDYLGRRYRLVAVAEAGAAEQRAPDTLWCAVAVDEFNTEICHVCSVEHVCMLCS